MNADVAGLGGATVPRRGTDEATFAFVDLAGFTALTEAHGDEEAVAVIRAFRGRARDVLGPSDELVKTIGDAVMLRFPTPRAAVVALQELFRHELTSRDTVLVPRGGAHHGCAVAVEGDYYGAAVNLAARIAGHAQRGQLLVSGPVADAAQELGAVLTHLGVPELRNVSERVDLYEVRVPGSSGEVATDLVCQMQVPVGGEASIGLDWSGRRHHFCGLPCVARFAADPDRFVGRAVPTSRPAPPAPT